MQLNAVVNKGIVKNLTVKCITLSCTKFSLPTYFHLKIVKIKTQYAAAVLWKTIVQMLFFFGKPLSHLSVWHPDMKASFTWLTQLDQQAQTESGTKTSKHTLYNFHTIVTSATAIIPWRTIERTFSPGEEVILAKEQENYHIVPFIWSVICWLHRQLGGSQPVYLVQSLSPE